MSRWLSVTVIVLSLGLPAFGQTPDAHIGTWKINLAKTKRDPSSTPLGPSTTRKYEVFEGDGLKLTVDNDANGKRVTGGYAAHFDGKPYKDLGNNPWDSIALKRVDAYTYEATLFAKGKIYGTNINSVSKDGKTMTVTSKQTNAAGKTVTNITVYDKQ